MATRDIYSQLLEQGYDKDEAVPLAGNAFLASAFINVISNRIRLYGNTAGAGGKGAASAEAEGTEEIGQYGVEGTTLRNELKASEALESGTIGALVGGTVGADVGTLEGKAPYLEAEQTPTPVEEQDEPSTPPLKTPEPFAETQPTHVLPAKPPVEVESPTHEQQPPKPQGEAHEFSSTQANLPPTIADSVRTLLPYLRYRFGRRLSRRRAIHHCQVRPARQRFRGQWATADSFETKRLQHDGR